MSIQVNDSIRVNAPKPTDARYLKAETTAWVSAAEVNTAIPLPYRHPGMTVLIGTSEYWYVGGVADVNLVKKSNTDIILNLTADGFYQFPADALIAALVVTPDVDIALSIGASAPGDLYSGLVLGAGISSPINLMLWRNASQRIYFSGLAGSVTKIIIKTL